jgi:UDP-N-acetylglucosamine 2-epimerase (non-hydrolysing)
VARTQKFPRAGNRRKRLLIIAGTRPEAIKLVPVARCVQESALFDMHLCAAGQHDVEVRHVLDGLGIPYTVLPLLRSGSWRSAYRRQASRLRDLMADSLPDAVMVQGDTWSALAGVRAARSFGIPVFHLEAGLRTSTTADPYPEELIRRIIARHAWIHLAPTPGARANLVKEGVAPERIFTVGSTAVDALQQNAKVLCDKEHFDLVVTLHRRENWGENLGIVCAALLETVRLRPQLRVLWSLHPNQDLSQRVISHLAGNKAFRLVAPLPHAEFAAAVTRTGCVLTDSGGIQEEVPYLEARALVVRSSTERPESIASHHVRLADPGLVNLQQEIQDLLDSERPRRFLFGDREAPWGDGFASQRVMDVLEALLGSEAYVQSR